MLIFPKFTECDINDNTYSENETQSHFRISIRTSGLNTDSFSNSSYPTICYSAFEDIRILYNSDKCNLLKRAPKLIVQRPFLLRNGFACFRCAAGGYFVSA